MGGRHRRRGAAAGARRTLWGTKQGFSSVRASMRKCCGTAGRIARPAARARRARSAAPDRPVVPAQAGAGGTDAQDWAEMLERMYLRWASAQGLSAQAIERSPGARPHAAPAGEVQACGGAAHAARCRPAESARLPCGRAWRGGLAAPCRLPAGGDARRPAGQRGSCPAWARLGARGGPHKNMHPKAGRQAPRVRAAQARRRA